MCHCIKGFPECLWDVAGSNVAIQRSEANFMADISISNVCVDRAVAKKCVEVWTQPEWHASSSSQNIDQLEGYDTMPYLLCLLKVLLAEGTVKGDRFHERMLITADEDVILCSCVLLSQECTP